MFGVKKSVLYLTKSKSQLTQINVLQKVHCSYKHSIHNICTDRYTNIEYTRNEEALFIHGEHTCDPTDGVFSDLLMSLIKENESIFTKI